MADNHGQQIEELNRRLRHLRHEVLLELAEKADTLLHCTCGHGLDEHNGLGCYARLSYTPLVTCDCEETDDRSHEELLTANLLRLAAAALPSMRAEV